MQLSFGELAVLASANRPKDRGQLARDAATLYQSTKYDAPLALVDIKTLEERRFLQKSGTKELEITRAGWQAMMEGLQVVENVRAALGSVRLRIIT